VPGTLFLALFFVASADAEVPSPRSAAEKKPPVSIEPSESSSEGPVNASTTTGTPVEDNPHNAGGTRLAEYRPVSDFTDRVKKDLKPYGVTFQLDLAFFDQYANHGLDGLHNFGTFSWRLWVEGKFASFENFGSLYLETTILGSPGLNYDPKTELLTRNVGSISFLNGIVYPDDIAMDGVALKWVSPKAHHALLVGRIDLSNRFDTNRVANDGFRQFIAFALQNNLSIPWSVYGGPGAFIRQNWDDRFYTMFAVSTSDATEPFDAWNMVGNPNWYEMAEIGAAFDVPHLGVGHYRLTPWHNHLEGSDGFGVGINFDQELGRDDIVAFFRFGIGDRDVTPVKTFVSAGVTWIGPFHREHDMVGLGFAWSDPTRNEDEGFRDETLIEFFYRFAIRPWIQLSPDLQIVVDPASNPKDNVVFVPGIRLSMSF
jgi:porin